MKNGLIDLNNHLFAALERLNDESIVGGQLETKIARAKAMNEVAGKIIDTASLALQSEKLKAEYGARNFTPPVMIEKKDGEAEAD